MIDQQRISGKQDCDLRLKPPTKYTNRSLTVEGAGAGVYLCVYLRLKYVYCINRCAYFNLQRKQKVQDILTNSHTDSNTLKSNKVNSQLSMLELNTLGSQNMVWILWVPDQIGLEGSKYHPGKGQKSRLTNQNSLWK